VVCVLLGVGRLEREKMLDEKKRDAARKRSNEKAY
jgi:hypothetical protein